MTRFSLRDALQTIVVPGLALLPPSMDSREARVMLLATALQESRFEDRYQKLNGGGKGPARGFWQFERGGVRGVLMHAATTELLHGVCLSLGVQCDTMPIWQAIETDDLLAVCVARLLLLTDKKRLPLVGDAAGAWAYYERNWRPGKPRPESWPALYARAVDEARP